MSGRMAPDLAAELAGLRGVDWASVWAGPPQGGSAECRTWCERYGWEPQTADRNLVVLSRSGGRWTFEAGGNWHPVRRLTHWAWHLKAVPEDQKEAHAAIVDRLSTASSYQELNPTTAEAKRRERMSAFIPGVNQGHGLIRAPRSVPTGHGVSGPAPGPITPKPSEIEH
ncbi:hypothetical protein ABZW02_28015 [Streptomyces sp. NPDC005180]|uniref:hypothetical protein n=1 Tax=Streptomyces sp. NPDC005180 TaxID=3156868 RepID=UPI0033AA7F41